MSSSVIMLIILAARLLCMLARRCSCDPIGVPCNFKDIHCPLHDNCNSLKENVALGKETRIRSVLQVERIQQRNLDVLGCVAVNGNINPHFQAVRMYKNTVNANCFRSGETDRTPYWKVDLGRTYTVSEIAIVVDSARKNLMLNVEVYVNDLLCYKFTSLTIIYPYMTHIRCNTPISGRIVKLAKTTPPDQRITPDVMLSFCEVQVWVCKNGLYGRNCDKECLDSCIMCDNYNGECKSCETDYYGKYCTELCRCSNKGCDRDGNCLETTTTPAPSSFQRAKAAVLEAINSPGLSESPGSEEETQIKGNTVVIVIVVVVVGTLGLFFIGVGIYCCCKKRTAAAVDYTIISPNGPKRRVSSIKKGSSIHIELGGHGGGINITGNNNGSARHSNGSKRKGSAMKKGRSRHRDDLNITENRIGSTRFSNGSKRKKGRSRHRENLYITESSIGSTRDVNASRYCDESDYSYYSGFRQVR